MTPSPTPIPDSPDTRCTARALFVYDVGLSIDLKRAESLLNHRREQEPARPPRATPSYFEFKAAPLRMSIEIPSVTIAGHTLPARADVVLYDFGAATIAYRVDYEGPLVGLLPIADALYDCKVLIEASRERIKSLLDEIRDAVSRPMVTSFVEDYVLYQFEQPRGPSGPNTSTTPPDPAAFIAAHAPVLARILRAEQHRELSEQEILDSLSSRMSYTPRDIAVIDWNAALLILDEPEEVRSVLEFANVELLEMRHLDDQLDRALEAAVPALARRPTGINRFVSLLPGITGPELDRVAELQVEGSLLFENVNNALKLLGDQYLARVYRMAASKLHLPEWDTTILRKLNTLESIYQKLSDRRSSRRLEVLEWIVIMLIALEIVLSLLPGRR